MNRVPNFGTIDRIDAAYEVDVAAWCEAQAALLRARAFDAIDLDNIIEEIESLGGEQANAVGSHLARLIEHLLKLDASTDRNPRRGWRRTVIAQRARLKRRLQKNPSLRAHLGAFLDEEWPSAVALAKAGLREDEEALVDSVARYTLEQLLDESYFGEREATA
jgi:hypothetical protein